MRTYVTYLYRYTRSCNRIKSSRKYIFPSGIAVNFSAYRECFAKERRQRSDEFRVLISPRTLFFYDDCNLVSAPS